jgi:hypothetical protein
MKGYSMTEREKRDPPGKSIAKGAVTATEQYMDDAFKAARKAAAPAARAVLTVAPKAGGLVLDGVEIATGKDKVREFTGAIGGLVGGAGGAAFGALTGPGAVVNSPLGAAVGSHYGERVAEHLYDRYADDVRRGVENGAASIRRGAGSVEDWMKARARDVLDRRLYRY